MYLDEPRGLLKGGLATARLLATDAQTPPKNKFSLVRVVPIPLEAETRLESA